MSTPPALNIWESLPTKPDDELQSSEIGPFHPGDLLSPQDVLKLMQFNPHSAKTDLTGAFQFGNQLSRLTHARIQRVLWNAYFRDWISTQTNTIITGILAIEVDKNAVEPSALTHYAAMLSRWVANNDDRISLVFISTRMPKREGDRNDIRTVTLLRSLCCQILNHKVFSEIGDVRYKALDPRLLENGDFGALCALLTWLIKRLTRLGGTLFCFINGADILANDERDALCSILAMFEGLTIEADKGGDIFCFKVLLTFAQPVPQQVRDLLNPPNPEDDITSKQRISNVLTVTDAAVSDEEFLFDQKHKALIAQNLDRLLDRTA